VIGLAVRDFLTDPSGDLASYMGLYQAVGLPRAQKAQITSRDAGLVYEFQGPDFEGLTFEQGIPIAAEKLRDRMAWVWTGDVDKDYLSVKAKYMNVSSE
jgi:salicylate hydroxylase